MIYNQYVELVILMVIIIKKTMSIEKIDIVFLNEIFY